MSDYFRTSAVNTHFTNADAWVVLLKEETIIKQKIEKVGKPLKQWDISIYRGVLTGFNEAFIIDGSIKDALIAEDPKSREIIRPILRGKDIKKYKAEFADLYLIAAHNGIKEKGIKPINVEKDYPSVFKHLKQFESELKKRQDKGDHWANLRNCAYWEEFEKEKIVWLCISDKSVFAIDKEKNLVNNAVYFFTGTHLESICCFLNSRIIEWYFDKVSTATGQGTNKWEKFVVELIPIPIIELNPLFQHLKYSHILDILFSRHRVFHQYEHHWGYPNPNLKLLGQVRQLDGAKHLDWFGNDRNTAVICRRNFSVDLLFR